MQKITCIHSFLFLKLTDIHINFLVCFFICVPNPFPRFSIPNSFMSFSQLISYFLKTQLFKGFEIKIKTKPAIEEIMATLLKRLGIELRPSYVA